MTASINIVDRSIDRRPQENDEAVENVAANLSMLERHVMDCCARYNAVLNESGETIYCQVYDNRTRAFRYQEMMAPSEFAKFTVCPKEFYSKEWVAMFSCDAATREFYLYELGERLRDLMPRLPDSILHASQV